MRLLTCFLQLVAGLALPAVSPQVRPTPTSQPGSPHLHPSIQSPGAPKPQTHSLGQHLQGCPHISREPGWTMLSGRSPQAGLTHTSALGSVVVGAGKPQAREGGFLSGPWSHRGFAKSISPLIPGRFLTLWSGSRPVTRQAPPGPLTWSGGGGSQ